MEQFNLDTFRNAAPYIYAHKGHVFVITLPADFIKHEQFASLVQDLALMQTLGAKLVLVHSAEMNGQQRRSSPAVISKTRLAKLQHMIGEQRAIIESLFSTGLINTPMAGMKLTIVSGNFVHAKPKGIVKGKDQQYFGEVRRIDAPSIMQQLDQGNIVLLPSLGYSPSGECFYVDGHDVATTAAETIHAEKLIFMMDQKNLLDSKKQRIKFLTLVDAQTLLKRRKSIDPDVQNYIELAINACLSQVQRVHLLSVHVAGALLQELYSHDGAGTLISAELYDDIHPATIEHVGGILSLIKPLEEQGILLPRTRDQVELDIHQYDVIERDGFVIACGALHLIEENNSGEIACLAVHPDFQKEGYGSRLLAHIEEKAWSKGMDKLFILTTKALHWFSEHGYKKSTIKDLPVAKQNSYNYQRNSQVYIKAIQLKE